MCGFAGVLSASVNAHDEAHLRRMRGALDHRGPDDNGLWLSPDEGLSMAHTRLAVLELSSAGHQPMHSDCGRFVLAFNGEIYNHLELRQTLTRTGNAPDWRGGSDTETLLAAIVSWGLEAALKASVGMWALALWDRRSRELSLARDRAGEKPLYFGWQGDAFLFGSEPAALARHPACKREIDRSAVVSLLRYKNIPAPQSIYRGIGKLRPGRWLRLSMEQPEPVETVYWSAQQVCAVAEPFAGSRQEASVRTETLLRHAIEGQQLADVPVGAFLSGGIDSTLVVALMQELSDRPVRSFTIGFEDAAFDESPFAARIAKHLGTDHTELRVGDVEARAEIPGLARVWSEPFADSSQIPTLLVSRLARQQVTVALSGDGGDELFAGYNRHVLTHGWWPRLSHWPFWLRATVATAILAVRPGLWNQLGAVLPIGSRLSILGDKLHKAAAVMDAPSVDALHRRLLSHWPDPTALVPNAVESETVFDDELPSLDPVQRMQLRDFLGYLPDDILTKVDRAAMSVSLETRVPYLDHRLVEWAWSLPAGLNIEGGLGKRVLRDIVYRRVPRRLLERPKMGFGVPLADWLRGPLRDWAESQLAEDRLRRDGLLDPAPIRAAWSRHQSGRRNEAYRLWDVLMLNNWLDAQ